MSRGTVVRRCNGHAIPIRRANLGQIAGGEGESVVALPGGQGQLFLMAFSRILCVKKPGAGVPAHLVMDPPCT